MTLGLGPKVVDGLRRGVTRGVHEARAIGAMYRAGAIGGAGPVALAGSLKAMADYGPFGAAVRVAAIRSGDSPAISDERGDLTYAEFEDQINRLTNAFIAAGLRPGDSVGMLCRNSRAPLLVGFAASRAGLRSLWLNTAFSARQLREVVEREGVDLLVHDTGFAAEVDGLAPRFGTLTYDLAGGPDTLTGFVAAGSTELAPSPDRPGRIILLTSGTTGTPKGAPRTEPKGLIIPGSLLERMPMRSGEATVIGPPIFHGTGLLLAALTISLGNKLVLRSGFDAKTLLEDVERHRATTICVVPVMLQRINELGRDVVGRHDLGSLRVLFSAGSQLPADVAARGTELLGPVIYNLYGSTEVSIATLATPDDVREAPTSVGRPAMGVTIRIYDEQGRRAPTGTTGRIFVGAAMQFEGYTGGGGKDVIDGLMATGDVGHFDESGRLYIDGRDDEMIVSGGENVFPREVEELLMTHPAIADAAAVGVEDADFGQRLRAFCVLREGQQTDEESLKAFVKENLARYKVPREVVFLDDLPRNPTGKVLKRQLAEMG